MASDIFNDAVITSTGILSDCEFCGRTCFVSDPKAGDWEDGEFEHYMEKSRANPSQFVPMTVVRRGRFDGKEGVLGCPCGWDNKAEEVFWNNRKLIMKYISARVKVIVEQAIQDEGLAENAELDVEQEEKAKKVVRCSKCLKFVSELAMTDTGICIHCQEKINQTIKKAQGNPKRMAKEDSWPDAEVDVDEEKAKVEKANGGKFKNPFEAFEVKEDWIKKEEDVEDIF